MRKEKFDNNNLNIGSSINANEIFISTNDGLLFFISNKRKKKQFDKLLRSKSSVKGNENYAGCNIKSIKIMTPSEINRAYAILGSLKEGS